MNENEPENENEESEHFKIVQRNKKAAEQPEPEPQPQPQPQPEQLQEQSSGISDILKSANEMLSNPILRQAIIKNPEVIKDLISENAGELEPVVLAYLQSNYPDVYDAVSKVNDKVDKPDARSGMIPQEQFKADIIDLDSQGYNLSQIAAILTEEYNGKVIYAMQVSRVLKKAESEQEEEAKQKEQENKQPKTDIANLIAQQVAAQKLPVRPAPMPAPAFKIPDMYSNIISTLRWSAVAILTGILGFILGKVM